MKYTIGKHRIWLLAIGCWLLAACSSSETSDEPKTGSPLKVLSYAAPYQDISVTQRAMSAGFSEYTPNRDISLGLFVVPVSGPVAGFDYTTVHPYRYSSGAWHSQTLVQSGTIYNIYGYMSPSEVTVSSSTAGSVQMQFANVDGVVTDDVCFVVGVKDNTTDLLQGSFQYTGKTDNNYVYLLMDHLFASVNFKFTLDATYSQLRSIKLKSLTLKSTVQVVTATVTLTPNSTGADPVSSVSYDKTDGVSSAMFYENALGEELSASAISSFSCSYAPTSSNTLTLVSVYDVYDSKGNLIRENCTATNQLPVLNATRGQRVTFNLKVVPTYLYILSDPDLDNPTVKVES